jgi:hypothetical protein
VSDLFFEVFVGWHFPFELYVLGITEQIALRCRYQKVCAKSIDIDYLLLSPTHLDYPANPAIFSSMHPTCYIGEYIELGFC